MIPTDFIITQILNSDFKYFIELAPLIWLFVSCLLDLIGHATLRSFFCSILEDIQQNKNIARGENTPWICPILNDHLLKHTPDVCPIFHSLDQCQGKFDKNCPDVFYKYRLKYLFNKKLHLPTPDFDFFWGKILNAWLRAGQATYFEIIIIQFVIVFLLADSITAKLIGFSMGFTIAVFGYFYKTYIRREPWSLYVYRGPRFGFVTFILILCFALFIL